MLFKFHTCLGKHRPQDRVNISASTNLMDTNITLVTEHHVIPILTVRGPAHITDDILVIFDAQPFFSLDGVIHVLMTVPLQHLNCLFHRVFIQEPTSYNRERKGQLEDSQRRDRAREAGREKRQLLATNAVDIASKNKIKIDKIFHS